ncbi:UDP-2,4-diacetamido-2,4,6-trideoxy-beta-L-altropyranose hydrolase [Devosia sediminis]|uniref:UDP-2,4-diacetamido-2,4, 6-trideoxy-beta-L-altropyranose hydrolase n=1 Tax=Devosia sediminis TaxID=2798801 RepID=A0A934IZY4_9HYPH|nr:UDP-2,4-diacetamido-2,4,6-trideoxy-beta-L-altropyranose hydrolase [Devosia sediminis]MBJ3785054.1 UDP-2,4-diacetamido-2,4,6-trideoxy-beta-L-altropyranose hydrolase [Devosia sediminis]
MQIVFRADAGIEMGTGHVMRCLTVADRLAQNGHHCHFITRDRPGHMGAQITARGHGVSLLPTADMKMGWLGVSEEADAAATLATLGDPPVDWIVTDNYGIGATWERRARQGARRILAIDDLVDRKHDCDLLLDQTLGRVAADYAGLVPDGATCLVGAGMALLRPRFAQLRETLPRRRPGLVRRLLVSLGGSDATNLTSDVIEAIDRSSWPGGISAQIVLGGSNPWIDVVSERVAQSPWPMEVIVDTPDMADLMAGADLAIGTAGTTSWERCCLGLPTIVLVAAENQRQIAAALVAAGAAISLEISDNLPEDLATGLSALTGDVAALSAMSQRASALVDGLGCEQVVLAMENMS